MKLLLLDIVTMLFMYILFSYRTLDEEIRIRQPLYVGVMTAEKFLTTRATAVNNTWGKYVDKMEFFAQKGTYEQYNLRLVNLGNFMFYTLLFTFLNSLSFKLNSEHLNIE